MKVADKKKIQQWLWKKYKGKCYYCEKPLSKKDATMDHWVPKLLGGTNIRSNLRLSCFECNNSKGHKHPLEVVPVLSENHK